jgi:hypothetical protein
MEIEYLPSHFNHWNDEKQFKAAVYYLRKYRHPLKDKLKERLCILTIYSAIQL